MLQIDQLIPTQDTIRIVDQLRPMARYVRSGGRWTAEALKGWATERNVRTAPMIAISRFPDGVLMVHDGHHRVVATYLGGRHFLHDDEYIITDWTYELYLEINPAQWWVTPFDPRTEVRLGDFADFKREAMELANDPKALEAFIMANRHRYMQTRTFNSIKDLAEEVRKISAGRHRHLVNKTSIYGNCAVQNPDGDLMFRCEQRRANWYLDRQLAEVVEENPFTIRLNFWPAGPGNCDNEFYLKEKQNICVVCGTSHNLTRHHCVPHQYRRYFPDELKNYSSHDVLPVCFTCHHEYELEANQLKREISAELGVSFFIPRLIDQVESKARGFAYTLSSHWDTIPESRRQQMVEVVEDFVGHKVERDELHEIGHQPVRPLDTEAHKNNGEFVVVHTKNLQEFIIRWRRHFLATMHPAYMPAGWGVNHDHLKSRQKRISQ